jgi:adenylate kinase family enzyme
MARQYTPDGTVSPRSDITVIFATGPAGNGKTTLLELLEGLLMQSGRNKLLARIDMSAILIKWGMNQHGKTGDRIRACRGLIEQGKYVPDDVTIPTFIAWLQQLTCQSSIKTLLIGGAPRTIDQLQLLHHFSSSLVIHMTASREQSDAAIRRRFEESQRSKGFGEQRLDSVITNDYLNTRWHEYEHETVPAMTKLGQHGLELSRADMLTPRLTKVLTHLKKMSIVPQQVIRKAEVRLAQKNHGVRMTIDKIEGVVSNTIRQPVYANASHNDMVCSGD